MWGCWLSCYLCFSVVFSSFLFGLCVLFGWVVGVVFVLEWGGRWGGGFFLRAEDGGGGRDGWLEKRPHTVKCAGIITQIEEIGRALRGECV